MVITIHLVHHFLFPTMLMFLFVFIFASDVFTFMINFVYLMCVVLAAVVSRSVTGAADSVVWLAAGT